MKLYSLVIFSIFMVSCSFSQQINWENLTEFSIYKNIRVENEKYLTLDILKQQDCVKVDINEVKEILKESKLRKGLFLWKGRYLAIAEFDNQKSYIIKISRYGGVFQIDGRNHLIPHNQRNAWNNLLIKYKKKLYK